MAKQYAQVDFYGNSVEMNNPRKDIAGFTKPMDKFEIGIPIGKPVRSIS